VIYAEGAPAETLLDVEESAVNFADYLRRYGTPATAEVCCAPLLPVWGGRNELKSRFRSSFGLALSAPLTPKTPLISCWNSERLEQLQFVLAV
jgi:hypothetical protein